MRNFKWSRNLWLFAGFCFLLSFIFSLIDNKAFSLNLLNIVVSILSFFNAYMEQKKIDKNK